MRRLRPAARVAALALCTAAAAVAGDSTLQNPTVTFATPGVDTVTLQVCNGTACSTISKQVTVLDPAPAITLATTDGLVAGAVSAEVGQLVHLAGAGTGKPALDFTWNVLAGATSVASLNGAPEAWWDTSGFAPGVYTVLLHLANPVGALDSAPFLVTLLDPQSLDFYTLPPCRMLDTRLSAPLQDAVPLALDVGAGSCGVPAEARALALNVTVVEPTAAGSLTLFPGNYPVPVATVTNFAAGITRANSAVVGIATAGARTIAADAFLAGGGTVHLVIDVSGYFAPTPP